MLRSSVKKRDESMGSAVTPEIYRGFVKPDDMVISRIVVKQTDMLVSGFRNLGKEARRLVYMYRRQLEDYIERHPYFEKSFVPLKRDPSAPAIINTMIEAAARADVGPMASVAGAIAEYVGSALLPYSRDVIVENGGDVYIRSEVPRKMLLLAENSDLGSLHVKIPPSPKPIGVCTSSGTLGHSVSFGNADAVTVLGSSASLADAAATAIANVVKKPGDIMKGIKRAQEIGVDGVVILVGGQVGAWGNIAFAD